MEEILKVLNYQPADIIDEDLENPILAIGYFFVNYPLNESRAKLWELYKEWVYSTSEMPEGQESKDMLLFYCQLVEVMNLWYVFVQQNKNNSQIL